VTRTFKKTERLCSKKAIEALFERGNSFYMFPFQVVWLESPMEIPFPSQVAFSVSKKSFKRAVKRNLIKRRIKEAYRKNKHSLYEFLANANKKIIFIIIYKGDLVPGYTSVEKSVNEIIERLISDLNKTQKLI
jgi:ribonuclease P protein component